MALPVNTSPVYSMVIPSTGQEVKFRPFLVKDEKALLIAQQSEDPEVMAETLKTVISSCIVTSIDVEKLATFDLEYIFTQLRAKSVGEQVDLLFPCDVCPTEDETARVKISFDLTKIRIEKDADHTNKIHLFNDVGVVMSYPTIKTMNRFKDLNADNLDELFIVIAECVDFIYDGEEIHYAKEQSFNDVLDFMNNLTSEQFKKVQRFFETMPKLKQDVQYTCPVCQKQHNKTLEGLQSFF